MTPVLIDTDTFINLLRKRHPIPGIAQQHISAFGQLMISTISFYEARRGLTLARVIAQVQQLQLIEPHLTLLPVDRAVAESCANLYVDLQRKNALLPDADLLVAATALVYNLTLATSNQRHFGRIPKLRLVDWRDDRVG
ncbi:MAG: PIN domain-containing protein [Caldilineaceae bacterium]|nr:PIN domain-containing protein [Caldilineaceae bacterium]